MKTRNELFQTLRAEKATLRERFHVVKLGVFGSFARNDFTNDSDLDLLVDFEENTSNLFELKIELRRYLFELTGLKVDVAREKYLKPYVRNRILAEAEYVE